MNSFAQINIYINFRHKPDIESIITQYNKNPLGLFTLKNMTNITALSFLHGLLNYNTLKTNPKNKLNKFYYLRHLLQNPFYNENKQAEFLNIFFQTQQIYHIFCRAARRYKIRKAKQHSATTDLYFNSLENLSPGLVIAVYEDSIRLIYRFRLSDLCCIITSALSHSPNFFSDPQPIKNPYTNIPFNSAQLTSLYFKIKQSSFLMPPLFHAFFTCAFNLNRFTLNYECDIRAEAIQSVINNITTVQHLYYITRMLLQHKHLMPDIKIHHSFPKDKLIKTFNKTPYLENYLLESYSLHPSQRFNASVKLSIQLKLFNQMNPSYGRQIVIKSILPPKLELSASYNFTQLHRHTDSYIKIKYIDTAIHCPVLIIGGAAADMNAADDDTHAADMNAADDDTHAADMNAADIYYVNNTRMRRIRVD